MSSFSSCIENKLNLKVKHNYLFHQNKRKKWTVTYTVRFIVQLIMLTFESLFYTNINLCTVYRRWPIQQGWFKLNGVMSALFYIKLNINSKDIIYIEDITCPRVDTNFIFSCSTRYLTRSLRSLVRYRVEHEKIKFVSTSGHVIFCLLYRHR